MKIKYMGLADIRTIEKNDNFSGRLANKVGVDLVWDWNNNHLIDTEDEQYADVDDEVWELVLTEPDMRDVSEMKRIPLSEGEKMWRSMQEGGSALVAPGGVAGDADPVGSSGSITGGGDGETTVGGSTPGDGGGRKGRASGST